MATKETTQLSNTARSAIVSAFASALTSHENSGSVVTQVCDVAARHCKGESISKPDMDAIIEDIADARGWKADAKQRRSEVRIVLKAYQSLGEAVKLFTSRAKRCQWHDSMKIARRLNAGDNVKQAVAAAFDTSAGGGKVVSPAGRVAGALKALYKVSKGDKRAAILKCASLLNITLKVEA